MIDWKSILDEIHVTYWTVGKNVIPGATCIQCPCCDDHSHHGNFLPDGGYKCWRCNGAHPASVIARLGHLDFKSAQELIKKNSNGITTTTHENTVINMAKSVDIPGSRISLPIHQNYLLKRGLCPEKLESMFGIKYTGFGAKSNGIDISFRVIIPVFNLMGDAIAWQGRDVTGNHYLRYVFPKVEDCVEHYKKTLYCANLCRKSDTILVVEGVFDAWKLQLAGIPAVCTFGTSTTKEQVTLMAAWDNIIIAFDNEPEAQRHADEIAIQLASIGKNVYIAPTDFGKNPDGTARDFGDLTMEEVYNYKEEIHI